jgi:hypothetical protein
VAGWVCEKIAQNRPKSPKIAQNRPKSPKIAQNRPKFGPVHFFAIIGAYVTLTLERSSPKLKATFVFVFLKKPAQSEQPPSWRKFVQSGHPGHVVDRPIGRKWKLLYVTWGGTESWLLG